MHVVEDLQEVLLGDWGEGEFRRRAAIGDPEFLAAMATGRWDAIPGAERDEDLRARVTTTVLGLGAEHIDQTIAVVSHGGAINACLAGLLEIDRSHIAAIENTSITTVHLREGAPARLITMNDCNHLYDPVFGRRPQAALGASWPRSLGRLVPPGARMGALRHTICLAVEAARDSRSRR